jgi:hypothetical protein
MKIKISLSSSQDIALDRACDWLSSFFEGSYRLDERYRHPVEVQKILKPLVDSVPYVPIDKPLYRVIGSYTPLPEKMTLESNRVLSFTFGTGKAFWRDLADSIGALDGYECCYVMKVEDRVHEVVNGSWVVKRVLPFVKKRLPGNRMVAKLDEMANAYLGQKEVIAYSESPIEVVRVLSLQEYEL